MPTHHPGTATTQQVKAPRASLSGRAAVQGVQAKVGGSRSRSRASPDAESGEQVGRRRSRGGGRRSIEAHEKVHVGPRRRRSRRRRANPAEQRIRKRRAVILRRRCRSPRRLTPRTPRAAEPHLSALCRRRRRDALIRRARARAVGVVRATRGGGGVVGVKAKRARVLRPSKSVRRSTSPSLPQTR